jgi:NAD(P)H-dependent flavin oxidoreductase YrpB (nitropropane dioxygenase family)
MLVPWRADLATVRQQIQETRALTSRPFGINLYLEFPQEERLEAALDEGVRVISFFWRDPAALMPRAKAAGAPSYTRGDRPRLRDAPWIAVSILLSPRVGRLAATSEAQWRLCRSFLPWSTADGRGLAAALARGAAGAWIGTRFLAGREATIHPRYRELVLKASETDTVFVEELFDIGWPNAPHRVLRNKTVEAWEAAGCPPSGKRPGEGEVIATSRAGGPIVRYLCYRASVDTEGDIDAMPLWAGQGVGPVSKLQSAGDIVREIADEAKVILRRLAQ